MSAMRACEQTAGPLRRERRSGPPTRLSGGCFDDLGVGASLTLLIPTASSDVGGRR